MYAKADFEDDETRRMIFEYFIDKIYVFEDKLIVDMFYSDNHVEVSLDAFLASEEYAKESVKDLKIDQGSVFDENATGSTCGLHNSLRGGVMKHSGKLFLLILLSTAFVIAGVREAYAVDILDPAFVQDTSAVSDTADILAAPAQETTAAPAMLTYIDISIDTQTLVYYVNGSPVLITPCVTGSPGRSTPRGVFRINSCIPGKRLKGATWNVWVDRWMRFCGNCGIHDAKWRKSFGGEIYKTNGSHGCVNLPHDQALLLYSMVGVGTTVIVH